MARLILLNKPYGVISQFSGNSKEATLASFINEKGFYPAGRLDKDSEGLLLLTDNGKLQNRITHPDFKIEKTYLVQLEGIIETETLVQLANGVSLKDGLTRPADAIKINTPGNLWNRTPPIRVRKNIPTSWIQLKIYEGKNRQVRRMTAALGFPTLRLIRVRIGEWELGELKPGRHKKILV